FVKYLDLSSVQCAQCLSRNGPQSGQPTRCRCLWEGFMVCTELLEAGNQRQRQQVVRWIRSFPFGFITDRQYVIARALFSVTPDGVVHAGLPPARQLTRHAGGSGDGTAAEAMPVADLYCITKSIDHPGENDGTTGRVVQIPEYYSMWRCRTVSCPWGGERPAVEVVLLHSEDMRIPEKLARLAIKIGMSKFISAMAAAVPGFVRQRRSRCAPTQPDPLAYGHHHHAYGPAARGSAAAVPILPSGPEGPLSPMPGSSRVAAGPITAAAAAAPITVAGAGRALWQPVVRTGMSHVTDAVGAHRLLVASPCPPESSPKPVASHPATHSRFSLAQVALSTGGGGGGQYCRENAEEAGGSAATAPSPSASAVNRNDDDAGSVAIDPWDTLARAMTSTGLWRRQDLPPALSSAWGLERR
ncbi:hypothetical protein Vafri_11147, partial [Volvox africanus]